MYNQVGNPYFHFPELHPQLASHIPFPQTGLVTTEVVIDPEPVKVLRLKLEVDVVAGPVLVVALVVAVAVVLVTPGIPVVLEVKAEVEFKAEVVVRTGAEAEVEVDATPFLLSSHPFGTATKTLPGNPSPTRTSVVLSAPRRVTWRKDPPGCPLLW